MLVSVGDDMHQVTVSPTGNAKIDEIFDTSSKKRIGLIFESADPITVSDQYHTMDELYKHRFHLFLALLKVLDSYVTPLAFPWARCWKSKLHNDHTMYDGMFVCGITLMKEYYQGPPQTQYITYHLPMDYWFKTEVMELETAPPYDGFTSDDVLERLLKL